MTWIIDLAAKTATHSSGLTLRFTPAPDSSGAWDGKPVGAIPTTLGTDAGALARLMREAGDKFVAALRAAPKNRRSTIHRSPRLDEAIGASPPSLSGRLSTIADRYLEMLRRSRVARQFTEAELMAMRDCCNGTWFEPAQLIDGAILANVEDSRVDGLYEKWAINGDALATKLRALSFADQVALVEEIEQWWRTQCQTDPED